MADAVLHLIKLCVGVTDPDVLVLRQAERARQTGAHGGRAFLRTKQCPRRAAEIVAGGSVYWVMSGVLRCRQAVFDIVADQRDDGAACTAVLLDGPPVLVAPRSVRPFQGWRYLTPQDAPRDLAGDEAGAGEGLPVALRRELLSLCLL